MARPERHSLPSKLVARLAGRVYVLHAFQEKAKAGIETPTHEIELTRSCLKRAEEEHSTWSEGQKGGALREERY